MFGIGKGDVNVKIGATDATGAAFKSAEGRMKSLSGAAKGMMGALGVGLSVRAVSGMIKGAIDYGSAVSDAAIATQTNTEALQVFRYMAAQAGAKVEQMDKALIAMNKAGIDAANGLSTSKRAFTALGISVEEFNKLPAEEKFKLIATQIAKAKDQNVAMASAMDIMGSKNAPKLMEALRKLGTEGYDLSAEKAKKAGQVMSGDTIKRLDDASDAIGRLKTSMTIATGEKVGFWIDVFDGLENDIEAVKNLRKAVEGLKKALSFDLGPNSIPKQLKAWNKAKAGDAERAANGPMTAQELASVADLQLVAPAPGQLGGAPRPAPAAAARPAGELYQDPSGTWRNQPAGEDEKWLQDEIKKTADLNKKVAADLGITNEAAAAMGLVNEAQAATNRDQATAAMAIAESAKETARLLTVAANEIAATNRIAQQALSIARSERR